jgi:hypothetical protein
MDMFCQMLLLIRVGGKDAWVEGKGGREGGREEGREEGRD